MLKRCDSTLFKKANYDVSLNDSHKGIFHITVYSSSVLFEDDIKQRENVDGFVVETNKGKEPYETKIEIHITLQKGNLSTMRGELQSILAKASEYNILYSRDREAIMQKFVQFLKENKIEVQSTPQAMLGHFSPGGNAF